MKIGIAQTKSVKGNVQENILHHLQVIDYAAALEADLIIFPELSITGYEPDLALELAVEADSEIFKPFQEISDKKGIRIGIGMPTKTAEGILISMLIFQPKLDRSVYSKQILHSDEFPYFVGGITQSFLMIENKKIAIGICYETLQREHFLNAKKNDADIYIASVAKSQKGIEKAFAHFPLIAAEFKTPILMSNAVGFQDNFLCAGQSAVWDQQGVLLAKLHSEKEGVLIYDSELKLAKGHPSK